MEGERREGGMEGERRGGGGEGGREEGGREGGSVCMIPVAFMHNVCR